MPRKLAALFVSLALVVAACGDDDPSLSATTTGGRGPTEATDTGDAGAFPVTVTADNGEVTIDAPPEAIVSLAPVATEMLFAIGAGDQVVAVDEQSNFPPEAPVTDLSGFTPNVEAVAGFDPDLVVVTNDLDDVVGGLAALDIPTLLLGSAVTIDDTYSQIEVLGTATGNPRDAAALVEGMQADIDELVADLPARDEPLTYYHELDDTFFTATSSTFIGEVYALAGLENIADPADADGSGFPQLSVEFIIDADPDLIFLADTKCCGQTPETVAARPGWDQITAVGAGAVIPLDDDVASRWGPRIVDFLAAVVDAVDAVPVGE